MTAAGCGPLLVVIPAWNEENTVDKVVTATRKIVTSDIVVVDDCSSDQTIKSARKAGARILPLPYHLNSWGAMQTGIRYGLKNGYRCVLTLDSDGQHLPESVPAMVQPIIKGEADVVIGAYPERGSRGRKIAWAFFRMLTGLDYQDLGVLLLLRSSGLRIVEVPVIMESRENDKSRIFNSWLMVGKYMFQSIILCLAKTKKRNNLKFHE